MKKRFLSLAMALAMVLSLSLPAMAAGTETQGIAVQLNGQNIVFTDAQPILKDGRTYLPARAVFEAMGAKIAFDDATQTVTATREDMAVTMTVGSTDATTSIAGLDLPLSMDVAPFIEKERTYVPVRFAAEVFGCSVGWDQDDQTVILIDTLTASLEAMGERQYTWIEKMIAFEEKINEGKWAVDGSVTGDISMNENSLVKLDMALKGLVDAQNSGQMTITAKMDMTGMMDVMAAANGVTVEELGMTEADQKQEITMEVRLNLETGMIYMLGDETYCEMLGLENGTWLSIDMGDAFNASMDTLDMLDASGTVNTDLNDKDTAYQTVMDGLAQYYEAISDDGFKRVTGGYATTIEMSDASASGAITLMLETNSRDEVVGYELSAALTADMSALKDLLGAEAMAQLAAMGLNMDTLTFSMRTGMDSSNKSTMELSVDLGNTASMQFSGDMRYTAATETVETEPPAGSTVVDYFELLLSTAEAAAQEIAPAE